MTEIRWNPWKLTAIGMALVMVTALATSLVVAAWTARDDTPETTKVAPASPAPASPAPARRVAAPSQADIDACNAQARAASGDRTTEVVKDALIGGAVGAGVGAAGGAIAGGGKGAGKGAAIGGIVGATAGTLYGLNQKSAQDARGVEAYRACMRSRGHTS